MKVYSTDNQIIIKQRYNKVVFSAICWNPGRKKKGTCPFPIVLLHNLIFVGTGNQYKSGFFEVNLSGGVYEAHSEDFSFEPFCLPVHSAGGMSFGAFLVHFCDPKNKKNPL